MATSEQLIKTQKVVIGLFNAALGKEYQDALESTLDGGATVAQIANGLATHPLFTGPIIGFASTTEAKVSILMSHFGLSAGSENPNSADAIAEDYFTARINAGEGYGQIIMRAVNFLDDANVPSLFKPTANLLANKAAVGVAYSEDHPSTTLSELQGVLVGVTGGRIWTDEEVRDHIDNGGNIIALTTDHDDFQGTGGRDIFKADVINNSNTLQSGDKLDGGAGNDKLVAEIGSSQNFAISAQTRDIETVHIDARSDSTDSNDNNLQNNFVKIDARNMRDVTEWGAVGGRADVVIEDIEINADQITEDITFRMKDTDPGSNADGEDGSVANDTKAGASLHAYFEPNSLRSSVANQDSVVVIRLLDPLNAQLNGEPLANLPVNGFFFTLEGQTVTVQDQQANGPIDSATTYAELAAAIRGRLDAMGLTEVTVEVGGTFTESGTLEGVTYTGTGNDIILTAPGVDSVASGGFLNGVSQTGDFITIGFVRGEVSAPADAFITANLILDNVGRGGEGGVAEIGSMETRGGVEKFEVEVDRNSWLSGEDGSPFVGALRSTNDTLEVVDIVNKEGSTGYLYLGSGIEGDNDLIGFRPGPEHLQTDGLIDVRSVNAAEFAGNLKIGASLTDDVFDRYLKQTDTDTDGSEGDDDFLFDYNLGLGNDYLNMHIVSALTADSDFSFIVNGGAGDDHIRTDLSEFTASNYTAQKSLGNLTVNGGEGNDTIETLGAGDFTIDGGAGNDAIYADNTGASVTVPNGGTGTSAQQTLTFTAAAANRPGGTITVDGVAVSVGSGFTATQIAETVVNAFANNSKYSSVTNAAGVVTFTYASEQVESQLVTFTDTGTTGVAATAAATVIGVPADSSVSEVQTIQVTAGATAAGNITVGGVTVALAVTDTTAALVATKIAAALSGNAAFSSVVVGTNTAIAPGAALGSDYVVVTFNGTANEAVLTFADTDTTGAAATITNDVISAVPANGGVSEIQTITVTGGVTGPIGSTFTVDGVTITSVTGAETATQVGDLIAAAFAGSSKYSSVTNAAGVVTFTYADVGDQNLIQVIDATSGVASTIAETVGGVSAAGVVGVSEEQDMTFTAGAPTAAGNITVGGVTVALAGGETAAQIATAVANAFVGNPTYTSVAATADVVTFTFASQANEALITFVDTGTTGAGGSAVEITAGVTPAAAVTLVPTVDPTELVTSDIVGLGGSSHKAIWTANNQKVNGVADNKLITQDIAEVGSFSGIKGQLTVGFKGLSTALTNISSTNGTTNALQIRQALKDAVNNDAVLSKLLVVKDGPANTFVIESLIDGNMEVGDLSINFFAPLAVGATAETGRTQLTGAEVGFDATAANSAYAEGFAQSDAGVNLNGANSTIEQDSDNIINAGNGDDVIVLGTADNASVSNTTGTSNDRVVFTGDNFGKDTVVNFTTATAVNANGETLSGDDLLDFTSYLSAATKDAYVIGGSTLTDNDIILGNHTTVYTTAANTAAKGVVLEVHADDSNVMDVYKAESSATDTAVTLTLVGTVDMADVAISSLTAADFV